MKLTVENVKLLVRTLLEAEGDEESVDDIVDQLNADSDAVETPEDDVKVKPAVEEDNNVLEGSVDEQIDEFLSKYENSSYESDSFDPTKFATAVARLVRNSAHVLDIEGAIKKRAIAYVTTNYSHELASKVEQSLHKLTGKNKDYDNIVPPAKGAGPDIGTA